MQRIMHAAMPSLSRNDVPEVALPVKKVFGEVEGDYPGLMREVEGPRGALKRTPRQVGARVLDECLAP